MRRLPDTHLRLPLSPPRVSRPAAPALALPRRPLPQQPAEPAQPQTTSVDFEASTARSLESLTRDTLGLRRGTVYKLGGSQWNLANLSGRLVELSGDRDAASLTLAFELVREAQTLHEPTAWITLRSEGFYPPDVAASAVDLARLAVVRVPQHRDLCRAADQLARCQAFGLLVLDLTSGDERTLRRSVPMAVLSRLMGLAQKHHCAMVFLTEKPEGAPSLGSLISLRGQTTRERVGPDSFLCRVDVVRDKRRAPGWKHEVSCRGPAGLH